MTQLIPQLPERNRVEALQQALTAVRAIREEPALAEALAALAPHLPETLLQEVLVVARAIREEPARAEALAELASYLPESERGEALGNAINATEAISEEQVQAETLAKLTPHLVKLSIQPLFPLWLKALSIMGTHTRRELLANLRTMGPIVDILGGDLALADVLRSIKDVCRWWP